MLIYFLSHEARYHLRRVGIRGENYEQGSALGTPILEVS